MRTLYSITFATPFCTINPKNINPTYGIESFCKPCIVGFIICVSIVSISAVLANGTGDIAPIPPVLRPVSPLPIRL